MDIQKEIEQIRAVVRASTNVVFFGGAGVSTESGIPDFRGSSGLYTASEESDPPEYLLSRTCLLREPEKFYSYYRRKMLYPDARPNASHRALAALEEEGILKAVVTQNIDGLHQAAGSRTVYELHGSVARALCDRCGKPHPAEAILRGGIPRCDCGGMIRPDIVLYEEGLDSSVFSAAAHAIRRADVLIVGGSSLTVNPAASLVGCYRGRHMILINLSETPYDDMAEHLLRVPLSSVLPALC